MEGVGNLVKNRCPLSFPLGLVFGWGTPYSFFAFFLQMRFLLFFVVFEK